MGERNFFVPSFWADPAHHSVSRVRFAYGGVGRIECRCGAGEGSGGSDGACCTVTTLGFSLVVLSVDSAAAPSAHLPGDLLYRAES